MRRSVRRAFVKNQHARPGFPLFFRVKPADKKKKKSISLCGTRSDTLAPRDRELLWKFRYTLVSNSKALPKFLHSVEWRDGAELAPASNHSIDIEFRWRLRMVETSVEAL